MKNVIYSILERRHFWRYASFNEIAELYMSRTIRVIALNIVSGFTSVYLYESGYDLKFIIGFWLCFYILKIPFSFLAGYYVAWFGPKHGIWLSNLLYVPSMISLAFMKELGMIGIISWGFFMAVSASIYHICYMIDFSKVRSIEHAGKEIAYMNILEKVAIGISPIVGGLIALWFGLQVVILVAAILFAVSSLPLMKSIEPTTTKRLVNFRGFPWRLTYRSMFSQIGVGFDYVTTGIVWSLFIVIVIFPGAYWDVYVRLGVLSSVTILAAVVASYAYGKIIDKSKGGSLLKISVIGNALVHAFRPFSMTPISIVGINIANEVATMGYSMAFMRGVFDTADISGHRIAYLSLSDVVADIGSALACLTLLICVINLGVNDGLRIFFFFAAGFVLLIGTARFRIYL